MVGNPVAIALFVLKPMTDVGSDPPVPTGWRWSPAPGEISFEAFRSAGPGGQNVNKVSSAVRLRLDVANATSLPEAVKRRLSAIAGRRMSDDGILRIEARRFRSQERNRQDAMDRLVQLVERAARPRPARRPTAIPPAERKARLRRKRRRSEIKHNRQGAVGED